MHDDDNEIIPPFDIYEGFIVDGDLHDIHHAARKPDSSLDPIRKYATPEQLDELHVYFVGVWDKHHGF